MKGKRSTLTLPTHSGSVTVKATTYGPLAVHRTLARAKENEFWTVSHVESGMSIRSDFDLKRDAKAYAERLSALDWSGTVAEIKERNLPALREIREEIAV